DRPAHLASVHGYVDVFGELLPPPAAMDRLWDRVFLAGDTLAHDRLTTLLSAAPGARGGPGYAGALEKQLEKRSDRLFAARWLEIPRMVRCLRQNPSAKEHFPKLLLATSLRVREVVRELLLPDLGEELATETITPGDIKRRLDRLGPRDLLEEKILICMRLPHL